MIKETRGERGGVKVGEEDGGGGKSLLLATDYFPQTLKTRDSYRLSLIKLDRHLLSKAISEEQQEAKRTRDQSNVATLV